jgi:hypothetical protein
MSFPAEILESGISIARGLTSGVQETCILEQVTGSSPSGDLEYADPIEFHPIVDYTNKVSIRNAQIVSISATLTVLESISFNTAAVIDPPRKNPIDLRDRITLPDGSTGPIISVPGSVSNPRTGTGFIQVIEIGTRS